MLCAVIVRGPTVAPVSLDILGMVPIVMVSSIDFATELCCAKINRKKTKEKTPSSRCEGCT